jgi:hypothetical protein
MTEVAWSTVEDAAMISVVSLVDAAGTRRWHFAGGRCVSPRNPAEDLHAVGTTTRITRRRETRRTYTPSGQLPTHTRCRCRETRPRPKRRRGNRRHTPRRRKPAKEPLE